MKNGCWLGALDIQETYIKINEQQEFYTQNLQTLWAVKKILLNISRILRDKCHLKFKCHLPFCILQVSCPNFFDGLRVDQKFSPEEDQCPIWEGPRSKQYGIVNKLVKQLILSGQMTSHKDIGDAMYKKVVAKIVSTCDFTRLFCFFYTFFII